MAIIDVCTYNGEKELWDIRYNVLKDYVDDFIVVEFDKTFSGLDKLFFFPTWKYPKVRHVMHRESDYEKYRELAESSPNTIGATHWKREFMQKESIKDALTHLKDNDIVFIGDVDEVWKPACRYLGIYKGGIKLPLRVYTYYLNNRSTEQFWGTYVGIYGRDIKGKCLNHLRSDSYRFNPDYTNYCGWHFTSMGGAVSLRKKLTDSYTQESYATPEVLANLEYNIEHGNDFLGRDFTFTEDESDWPEYLKNNKGTYAHLCKNSFKKEQEIGKNNESGEKTTENAG